MAITVSTGYRYQLHSGAGWPALFNGGAIELYSGERPASANDAPSGTLLARITANGLPYTHGSATNGLQFAVSTSGFIAGISSENWVMTGIALGAMGWGRLFGVTDSFGASLDDARIDFDVNPADNIGFLLPSTVIDVGVTKPITYFLYGIPPFDN